METLNKAFSKVLWNDIYKILWEKRIYETVKH